MKNYFIALGVGIMILLVSSVLMNPSESKITGMATSPIPVTESVSVTSTAVPVLAPVNPVSTIGSTTGFNKVSLTLSTGPLNLYDPQDRLSSLPIRVMPIKESSDYLLDYGDKVVYRVNSDGSRWDMVNVVRSDGVISSFDPIPTSTTMIRGSGYSIVENGKSNFYTSTGNGISNFNSAVADQLTVNKEGKIVTVDGGYVVNPQAKGIGYEAKDKEGNVVRDVKAVGDNYLLICRNGKDNCNFRSNVGKPVEGFPNNMKSSDFKIEGNTISYSKTTYFEGGYFSSSRITTFDTAKGEKTIELKSGDKFISRTVERPDRSRTVYEVKDGQVTTVSSTFIGRDMVEYRGQDGEVYKITVDPNNKDQFLVNGNPDISKLPDDVRNAIGNNLLQTDRGRKVIGIPFKLSFVNTFSEARKTYSAIAGNQYWLDKLGWEYKWKSDIDKFFARNYLGTDEIISRLCDKWAHNTALPSSIAYSEGGIAAAHIEGDKSPACIEENGLKNCDVYIYKVTFYVSSYILRDTKKQIEFEIIWYTDGGQRVPLELTENVAGTHKLKIGKDINEVAVTGNNMIVRFRKQNFQRVCLDFGGSGSDLDGTFRSNLIGSQLCNEFNDKPTEEIPGFSATGADFMNSIIPRYSSGGKDAEDSSTPGGASQPSNPSVQNTGTLT